jgi:GT2 family glycosyltransferase
LTARPKVSVIVPHYSDLARLDLCLKALARQTYPAENIEVVVADNNSPEGEEAVARVINGRARLTVSKRKGAGPTRNAGVAASSGEILAFTDSDCQPEADWLAQGVQALSRFDYVGGGMKVLVDDPGGMTAAEAFESVFAFNNEAYVTRRGFTVTANLFCRRDVFDRVGGFEVGVSEDIDWSHRARDAGYRIGYAPEAVVGHPARRTWAELLSKWRRIDAEMYTLARERTGRNLSPLFKGLGLPFSALIHTPRVLFSRRLHGPGRRLAALSVLYRLRFWRFGYAMKLLTHPGTR